MSRVLFFLLLMEFGALPLLSQPSYWNELYPASDLYECKNVDAKRCQDVLELVRDLLAPYVSMKFKAPLKAIVIRGKTKADVDKALEILKRYDVMPKPRPQFQFTAYIVRGTMSGDVSAGSRGQAGEPSSGKSRPFPPDLASAIAEMKHSFAYDDYTLLDTVVTGTRWNAQAIGRLDLASDQPISYRLGYEAVALSHDGERVLINPFRFEVSGWNRLGSSFSSDVAIREDQKLILGKVRLRPGSSAATDIFVVLTVRVAKK